MRDGLASVLLVAWCPAVACAGQETALAKGAGPERATPSCRGEHTGHPQGRALCQDGLSTLSPWGKRGPAQFLWLPQATTPPTIHSRPSTRITRNLIPSPTSTIPPIKTYPQNVIPPRTEKPGQHCSRKACPTQCQQDGETCTGGLKGTCGSHNGRLTEQVT